MSILRTRPLRLILGITLVLSACSSGSESNNKSITKLHFESTELRSLVPPEIRFNGKNWAIFLAEREPVLTWRKALSNNLINFRDTLFSPGEAVYDYGLFGPETFMWKHESDGSKWYVTTASDHRSIIFLKLSAQGSTDTLATFKPDIQWGESWKYPSVYPTGIQDGEGQEYLMLTTTGENPSGNPFTTTHYFIGNIKNGYFFIDKKSGAHGYLDYGKDFFGGRFLIDSNSPSNQNQVVVGLSQNEAYVSDLPKSLGVRLSFPRSLALELADTDHWLVKQRPIEGLSEYHSKIIQTPGDLTGIQQAWINLKIPAQGTEETGVVLFKTARQELRIGYSPLSKTIFIDRTRSGRTDFSPLFTSIDRMQVSQVDGWVCFQILLDAEIVEVFAEDGLSVMTSVFYPEEPYGKAEWFGSSAKNEIEGFILRP